MEVGTIPIDLFSGCQGRYSQGGVCLENLTLRTQAPLILVG